MSDLIDHLKWKLINWLAGYPVGEESNRAWHEGLRSGLACSTANEDWAMKSERERIIALLEGMTAYDEDGDLFLAESWPELKAWIEGEQV